MSIGHRSRSRSGRRSSPVSFGFRGTQLARQELIHPMNNHFFCPSHRVSLPSATHRRTRLFCIEPNAHFQAPRWHDVRSLRGKTHETNFSSTISRDQAVVFPDVNEHYRFGMRHIHGSTNDLEPYAQLTFWFRSAMDSQHDSIWLIQKPTQNLFLEM
jgi:hypothetical protein